MKTDKAIVNKAIGALANITDSAELVRVKGTKEQVNIKIGKYEFCTITAKTITTGSKGLTS